MIKIPSTFWLLIIEDKASNKSAASRVWLLCLYFDEDREIVIALLRLSKTTKFQPATQNRSVPYLTAYRTHEHVRRTPF